MGSLLSDARQKVRRWAAAHPSALLYDEQSAALLDVASGKGLDVSWSSLTAFEEKLHPDTQESYLVLQFEDNKQIALIDPGGIAFTPSVVNSGPVENLPAVVCLRDFLTLKRRVDHYLYDHPDEPPPRESLNLIMICIAILDGARAIGLDVGDLEGELENSLNEVERRTG